MAHPVHQKKRASARIQRLLAMLMALAMLLSMCMGTALADDEAAAADSRPLSAADADNATPEDAQLLDSTTQTVSYIDADGSTQTVDAQVVTSSTLTWTSGWYVVSKKVQLVNTITVSGDVHLILADDMYLKVISSGKQAAAITCTGDSSLTIYGQEKQTGMLQAQGDDNSAAIGGSGYGTASGGNLTINGGDVWAWGGKNAAGIGGGTGGDGSNITINGGTVHAYGGTASGSTNPLLPSLTTYTGGAGIGGGYQGSGSNITIHGGTVYATGGTGAAGIGGGYYTTYNDPEHASYGRGITITGGKTYAYGGLNAAGIGGGHYGGCKNVHITGGYVYATGSSYVAIGGSKQELIDEIYIDGSLYVDAGSCKNDAVPFAHDSDTDLSEGNAFAKEYVAVFPTHDSVSYVDADGTVKSADAQFLQLTGGGYTWESGWYVVTGVTSIEGYISVVGDVHLILEDGASMTITCTTDAYSAIQCNGNSSLTIYGQKAQSGRLEVHGSTQTSSYSADVGGAGIGGGAGDCGEHITINGGTIYAYGGYGAAGIGGGTSIRKSTVSAMQHGDGNDLTINGGTVYAYGGAYAAGIGGGRTGTGTNITINGGTVHAEAGKSAAGIGACAGGDSCNNIHINGGTVYAAGGEEGNGIGSTSTGISDPACDNITASIALVVKAGASDPPTTVIAHDSTTNLNDNSQFRSRYVTIALNSSSGGIPGNLPDKNAYYFQPILWAISNGVTTERLSTFSPERTCTRAEIVSFLWRAAGSPTPENAVLPFADVAEDAWYAQAVLWAYENGITTGTDRTTFSPDATCTRAETVTFLWRAHDCAEVGAETDFTDVAPDAYYADAVRWATAAGITTGTDAHTFSPDESCTRGQVVTFLYRAAQTDSTQTGDSADSAGSVEIVNAENTTA